MNLVRRIIVIASCSLVASLALGLAFVFWNDSTKTNRLKKYLDSEAAKLVTNGSDVAVVQRWLKGEGMSMKTWEGQRPPQITAIEGQLEQRLLYGHNRFTVFFTVGKDNKVNSHRVQSIHIGL
jgi:hypothetical protein